MTTKQKQKKPKRINWASHLDRLTKYAQSKNYSVSFKKQNGSSTVDFSTRSIIVHDGHTKERQFYSLLHELGHAQLWSGRQKHVKGIAYGYCNFNHKSLISKVSEVEEEFEAWKIGLTLANKLRLPINRPNYELFKAQMIKTYFKWALRG